MVLSRQPLQASQEAHTGATGMAPALYERVQLIQIPVGLAAGHDGSQGEVQENDVWG